VRYDGATVRGATVQCGGPWPEGGVRRTFAPSFFSALLKA